jgi:ATP-binding cassette subfamily B protein
VDVIATIGWRTADFCLAHVESRGMRRIANECFEVLHRHSYNFFNNNFVGSLVKKVGRLTRAFEGVMDNVFYELYPIALRGVIVMGVLFYMSPLLGIPVMIWSVIFIGFNYYVSLYKVEKYDTKRVKADTEVTASIADTITNNVNLKLFATLPYEKQRFDKVTEKWSRRTRTSWLFNDLIEAVQAVLMIILTFTVLYVSIQLWKKGTLTVGDFVLIQGYLMELFRQLWNFGRIVRRLYEQFADAEEMVKIIETPYEVKDHPKAKPIALQHGKVEFKNVTFSYGGDKGVLKNFSMKVNPSEKVALIGPSGGGKSTLTKLILRLFDVEKGKLLIDGEDIARVTQDSLRRQIALVPQDPVLFHRTLIDNIRYGRLQASDEEVIAAAKMAHCHEFIQTFPKKYQTFVGERGVKLSGGERQRIAIARAILSNAKILILDEATSNLDSESERLIQDALKKLMKQKTTFVIAHRLSTIVSMDRILVLDGGKIIEEGSHSTLIRNKNSLYKKLWNLQVGGYLD